MLMRHPEYHFGQSDAVKDVVIGAADGLTVPFALAAGLAGAVAGANIVVTAGLAEIAAGAIAMGLGGYLAAQSERDHFESEYRRERREIDEIPEEERREVGEIFRSYGVSGADLERVVGALSSDPARWADFMMRFELGLERPAAGRALRSALTIGVSYFAAGLVPLLPYMLMSSIHQAFLVSVAVTLATLLVFGGIKGKLTGVSPLRAAFQTMFVGGVAAGIAFAVAQIVS
jgi:VIT1/CCC1 family predicted Fe2+/Mn2+ transporter